MSSVNCEYPAASGEYSCHDLSWLLPNHFRVLDFIAFSPRRFEVNTVLVDQGVAWLIRSRNPHLEASVVGATTLSDDLDSRHRGGHSGCHTGRLIELNLHSHNQAKHRHISKAAEAGRLRFI